MSVSRSMCQQAPDACTGPAQGSDRGTARNLLQPLQATTYREASMSYDILKNLGLDHLDATSPEFIRTLERMQKEAWQSLQGDQPRSEDGPETIVG